MQPDDPTPIKGTFLNKKDIGRAVCEPCGTLVYDLPQIAITGYFSQPVFGRRRRSLSVSRHHRWVARWIRYKSVINGIFGPMCLESRSQDRGSLANALLSAHPDTFAVVGFSFEAPLPWLAVLVAQLHLPDSQLVHGAVRLSCKEIKGPAMFWAADSSAENDSKVFNVKWRAIGKRVGVVRALLAAVSCWLWPWDVAQYVRGLQREFCLDI